MAKRKGRPRHQMTHRRRQLLAVYADMASSGVPVRLAELARRCGLCDYREARRIMNDLNAMGVVAR